MNIVPQDKGCTAIIVDEMEIQFIAEAMEMLHRKRLQDYVNAVNHQPKAGNDVTMERSIERMTSDMSEDLNNHIDQVLGL